MGFGQWLRTARDERGYSLRELARRSGDVCTFGYIAQIERGTLGKKGQEYQPDVAIIDALAVALDKPISEARLAAGYAPLDPPERRPPQTVTELVERLAELGVGIEFTADVHNASPEDLDKVLRIIEISLEVTLRDIHKNAHAQQHSLSPSELHTT